MIKTWGLFLFFLCLAIVGRILLTRLRIRGTGKRFLISSILLFIALVLFPYEVVNYFTFLKLTYMDFLVSILIGFFLSVPMIITAKFEIREDGNLYPHNNIWFLLVFCILAILKEFLRNYLTIFNKVDVALLVTIMGIAYLLPYRLSSYFKIKKLLLKKSEK